MSESRISLGAPLAKHYAAMDRLLRQERLSSTKAIPISAAKDIAEKYGYDQIIIIGRAVGESGHEHCTTYGKTKAHCAVAARIGDFLKSKVMGWGAENA